MTEDTSSPVAFTAIKTGGTQEINAGDVATFETTVTNLGYHYNPITSLFTCPVTGLYFITASPLSDNCLIRTSIVLEGSGLVNTRAQSSGYDQSGNSVFVECEGGQRIWVEGMHDGECMYGGTSYSSFSGMLLIRY